MKWWWVLLCAVGAPALAQEAPSQVALDPPAPETTGLGIAPRRAEAPPQKPRDDGQAAPLEGAIDPARYIVGPGDRLLVELWGLRDQSQVVEVNPEGRLVVPSIGIVEAGGQTLAALRGALEAKIHAVYPRLHGSITLQRPRTFLVHVTGAVVRPGTYRATAVERVSAIIPQAGGVLPSGSLRRVEIRRAGARAIVADLVGFDLLGHTDGDPTLLDGDTIYVPPRSCTVEVSGAVRRPGRYELTGKRDLSELLALAGGASAQASTALPWRLTTRGAGDARVARSITPKSDPSLRDGDEVHIPELVDLRRVVIVEGAVVGPPDPLRRVSDDTPPNDQTLHTPREREVRVPFVDGDGIRDLITKVHGLEPWADGRSAYVLRPQPDGSRRRLPVDVSAVVAGQAPELAIRAGDTLVVPSRRESVLVGGAVQHPGLYQFNPELHPLDYVNLAGGPTRNGYTSGARVLTPSGQSQKVSKTTTVEPGDTITIPERRLTAGEWVTISLVLSNLAVGVTALALTAIR